MKIKNLVVLFNLSCVGMLLGSASAFAAPLDKVEICHVNSANDTVNSSSGDPFIVFGKVISVSPDALEAHLAHGDSTRVCEFDAVQRLLFEGLYKISLPNANCLIGLGKSVRCVRPH
jgi:hypothetical protein